MGLVFFALIFPSMATPPAAELTTAKGGKVAGANYGEIEVAANTADPLDLSFASEIDLTGSRREPYALEIRAPLDGFIAGRGNNALGQTPLTLRLEFKGSADGSDIHVSVDDQQSMDAPQVQVSARAPSSVHVSQIGDSDPHALVVSAPEAPDVTVFYVRFDQTAFISRPADEGQTFPYVRFDVHPRMDNAAVSGPYHAIQAPNVATVPSNVTLTSADPWASDSGAIVFHAVTNLTTPRNIVDTTGAALLTSALASENTWNIAPGRLPTGYGPVISYIDQRELTSSDYSRQFLLLLAAAAIGASLTLVLDVILGWLTRRRAPKTSNGGKRTEQAVVEKLDIERNADNQQGAPEPNSDSDLHSEAELRRVDSVQQHPVGDDKPSEDEKGENAQRQEDPLRS